MIESIQYLAEQLWLFSINYFIHSTVLVGLVLLALHFKWLVYDRLGEWVMKSALLLGLVTALIQTNGWISLQNPWGLSMNWPVKTASTESTKNNEQLVMQPPKASQPSKEWVELKPQDPAKLMSVTAQPVAPVKTSNMGVEDRQTVATGPVIWLALWIAMITVFGYRLINNQRQWQRLIKSRQTVRDLATEQAFVHLLNRSGVPADTRLSQMAMLTSPIAMHNEVVCPTAFLQQQQDDRIEAALAHELAHIKRKDTLWLTFSQWFQLLVCFQPLNRILMQHIHQAAEQQADSMAAAWIKNPRTLAITLVDVAQAQQPKTQPLMVPAMTSKKSKLLQRVENIMQPSSHKTSRLGTLGLIGAVMLVLVAGPGVVAQTSNIHFASKSSHYDISIDGGVTELSISSSNDQRKLKVKAKLKGDILFNADESEIVSFPANSRMDLTHTENGIKQRILIESAPGLNTENAEYTYWYEGDKQDFDAKARDWFAKVMPMVWRETGLQAEARVDRLLNNGGESAVLDEVALIESDFVRKTYLNLLFNKADLNARDLETAMVLAADIGSDFELSHVLSVLVETQELDSEALWLDFFASTESIGSDFEMAKTMLNVLPQLPRSEAINQAYFVAAESIGSDFEMAKVLVAYLQQKGDEPLNVINLFDLAKAIGSDFELAKLMINANQHIDPSNASDAVFAAYLDLATHIGSDFEMKKVYADLLKHDLSVQHLEAMIQAAGQHIGSDFELASLLLSITQKQAVNQTIKDRIKAAAKSIGSEYERNRVLAAIS